MIEVVCPECKTTVDGRDVERKPNSEPSLPVARRQLAFDGSVSGLTPMDDFAYPVEMPCCGATVVTVN